MCTDMSRSPKRARNWLTDPPPDETPRERQYREGMRALIRWMAEKLVDEAIAEAAALHGVGPESVVFVLGEEVPVRGRRRARRKVDAQLGQCEAPQRGVLDLGDVGDGVGAAHR